jgi:6-phosphogluconolactonase
MKNICLTIAFLILVFVGNSQNHKDALFYVGTFTSGAAEGIYLCGFDASTGNVTLSEVYKGVDNPNFLRKSPDGKYLYAVTRSPGAVDPLGGSVNAYRITQRGRLEFINKQSSLGNGPCYVDISPDGRWLAIANYGGGSVVVYPLSEDGAIMPSSSLVKHRGSGPHPTRQKTAYAHSIRFSKDGNTLYAADLGIDQLLIYQLDKETGMLTPARQPHVAMPPGSGPRHFVFTSNEDVCYVANELNSTISVLESKNGILEVIQTLSTLPTGFKNENSVADIHLSRDEKFVYVSNRGHQSLAVFERTSDGKLIHRQNVPVQGDWPRNFAIDPSGKYLLVANQNSNNITVFELRNGVPVFTGNEINLPSPVCIEF